MLPHGGESIVPSLQIGQGWHMVTLLLFRWIKIWFPEQLVPPTPLLSSLHHHHCHIASFYYHENMPKEIKDNDAFLNNYWMRIL